MAAYVQDTSFFSRRALVMAAIIGMHVLIVYALATGLARKVVEVIAPPIETEIVEEIIEREEPPPPPPPEFERPPVEVPPPEVAIELPVEAAPQTAITNVTTRPQPPPPPAPPPRVVKRTPPRPGRNFPTAEEYYPAASKRLGEEGAADVRACVGANGRLTGEPTIAKSSGSSRLDEGAIKLAKAGRYEPGTEDGKPVDACFVFRIKFELRN